MKVFFRTIHLYLSLAAGLVIAVVCFTGAVLVFEKEMQESIYPERYSVTAGAGRVSLERMSDELRRNIPGVKIASAKVYTDPGRTVELNYGEGRGDNNQAFMNPYTGELIALYAYRNTFFFTMFSLHRWLLAGDVGKMIVGVSTVVFLFILITGIILWWPKNKKILKHRLTMKWTGGWKRLNHDLHIVMGFYTAIFLFAFAFTGLAWSFKWFNDGIYWVTGTENKPPKPPASKPVEGAMPISIDQAYRIAQAQMPGAEYYSIARARDPKAAIQVTIMPHDAVHERASSQIFIDQYSGNVIKTVRYEDRNLGQKVRTTFYPIHVGSIGGITGRIIAFIACVAGFTFPITGVILWINRLNKKKRRGFVRGEHGQPLTHQKSAEPAATVSR